MGKWSHSDNHPPISTSNMLELLPSSETLAFCMKGQHSTAELCLQYETF